MKCSKVRFANEKAALTHIEKIKRTSIREFHPNRAYLCHECGTWHLTSRTDEKLKRIAELEQQVKDLKHQLRGTQQANHKLRQEPDVKKEFNRIMAELNKSRTNPKKATVHSLTKMEPTLLNKLANAGCTIGYTEMKSTHSYSIVKSTIK